MKISASKKQLAKIISENGGWREGANLALFGKESGGCYLLKTDEWPVYNTTLKCFLVNASDVVSYFKSKPFANWHQTIVSRDEYFHLYPAPDDDGWIEWNGGECPVAPDTMVVCRLVEGHEWKDGAPVKASSMCWSFNGYLDIVAYRVHKPGAEALQQDSTAPTIDQLVAEYRNRKDYAERKQQEADAAKAEAETKLAELVAAGKALGLVLSAAGPEPEPELVITDWRDLQEGDEVEVLWAANPNWVRFTGKVISVVSVGVASALCSHGGDFWNIHEGTKWRFIRRPAKEADNA